MSFFYMENWTFFCVKKNNLNILRVSILLSYILLMENKKKFLIKVLKKLQTQRPLAEGFLALLESEYATDKIMDNLINALQEAIEVVKTDSEKNTFKKGLRLIKKIRNKEEQQEKKMTDEDLDKILETM